jgi:DNA modification methylase
MYRKSLSQIRVNRQAPPESGRQRQAKDTSPNYNNSRFTLGVRSTFYFRSKDLMMTDDLLTNRILKGDTLEWLAKLPEASVDLVFADPPYNLQLQSDLWRPNNTRVEGVQDDWDQFETFAAYDSFTHEWLSRARRVMKPTATIWVCGTYHNIFRVGAIMQDLGFWILNTISWYKSNATPNFRGVRLKNDVEFIIWAKPSADSRYAFNHHLMKTFNSGKQLGSMWAIPACTGRERLKDVNGRKLHPTQKPEALLQRVILASSKPGDVVLDPFLGSGTTAVVAARFHRRWLGIEREEAYIRAAEIRLDQTQPLLVGDPLLEQEARTRAKPARVPFRVLLEQGLVQAGQILYLDTPEAEAVILPDGRLQGAEQSGSIHRLGALLKGVPGCNGWAHWLYQDTVSGERQPIDVLRQQVRAGVAPG